MRAYTLPQSRVGANKRTGRGHCREFLEAKLRHSRAGRAAAAGRREGGREARRRMRGGRRMQAGPHASHEANSGHDPSPRRRSCTRLSRTRWCREARPPAADGSPAKRLCVRRNTREASSAREQTVSLGLRQLARAKMNPVSRNLISITFLTRTSNRHIHCL